MDSDPAHLPRLGLDSVDSTNAEARRRADAGWPGGWIWARAQTAGRGRRGQVWVAPPGNLNVSVLLPLNVPPAQAALRSFVAALALHDALVAVTGRGDIFSLKWPNDVLLNGQKLAGILLESLSRGGQVRHLIVGIGVNLAHAPTAQALAPGALGPVSLAQGGGVLIGPEAFLDHLIPAFGHWEGTLRQHGFAPLRTAWLQKAARLGQTITARLPDRTLTGTFADIDMTGALVLQTEAGAVTLAAADIHLWGADHAAGH